MRLEFLETLTDDELTAMDEDLILCAACNDNPSEVTCPSCNGNTCDCDKPGCATCADPSTECETCDNTGTIRCPACYAWT